MKLSTLAKELTEAKLSGDADIRTLCADSRVAGEGDLFFCFSGTHEDSHPYAREAEARGAAAIVCEKDTGVCCPQLFVPDGREAMARIAAAFYGHPERKLRTVGVTGTNGKTTVTHMIANILEAAGRRAGLVGTLGARYGDVVLAPELTTPDPISLFSLLSDMREAGVEVVAAEISAHALALKKTGPICFDVGVFTNLTQDHLDFFGDMQSYGEAKKLLFTPEKCRFAVLNADDGFSRELEAGGVASTTYGLTTPADCFAIVESETLCGSDLLLNLEDELIEAELRMTGQFNVLNALAAACAAKRLGATAEAIAEGLRKTRVDGRLERVGSFRGGEIFVDFAHTPDGLEKSISALRPHCTGKLTVLFGCGGNRDRGKRPKMGECAARLADFCVITSDNPRYEDPAEIIFEIASGIPSGREYVCIEEREAATRYALSRLGKGDVLLVAGKGGEKTQEIMGIKYDYNDKAVIGAILESL